MATAGRSQEALRWWIILVAVFAVVIAAAGLGFRQWQISGRGGREGASSPVQQASPSPDRPTATPTVSNGPGAPVITRRGSGPLVPGVGQGGLVVQTATAVYWTDLATGQTTRTTIPDLTQFSSVIAGRDWVMIKTIDNTTGVIVERGAAARPLSGLLRPNGRLYLTNTDDLWFVPEHPEATRNIVTRISHTGLPLSSRPFVLPAGGARSDEAGNLMITNAGGFFRVRPGHVDRLGTGQLLAAGQHHTLSWGCDHTASCYPTILVRSTQRARRLPKLRPSLLSLYQGDLDQASNDSGSLSPNGATAALELPVSQSPESWPLAVLDLTTGRHTLLPGGITDTNPNAQFAWSPDSRYLFAITDGHVRAYDTTTHTTTTISISDEPALHLDIAGQPSN